MFPNKLSFKDKFGAFKVQFNIGRMKYKVNPGLYAVGNPDNNSPVLVSANYKLTFDSLRKELGAPIVNAHEIARQTNFVVTFEPVYACDIKAFQKADCMATDEMRKVKFTIRDRLVLTPVEFVTAAKTVFFVFGILFLINLFAARPFGIMDLITFFAAIFTGTVITPVLLPFIPGRAFAFKGWLLGVIVTFCMVWLNGWFTLNSLMLAIGYMLVLSSYSAFLAMNFTGSSTYTSFSGVIKEMKLALPQVESNSLYSSTPDTFWHTFC